MFKNYCGILPIDTHPILRLVCKRWKMLCTIRCRINKLMCFADINLIKWILEQPNIVKWRYRKQDVVFTSLSLKCALESDNFIVADWIKTILLDGNTNNLIFLNNHLNFHILMENYIRNIIF